MDALTTLAAGASATEIQQAVLRRLAAGFAAFGIADPARLRALVAGTVEEAAAAGVAPSDMPAFAEARIAAWLSGLLDARPVRADLAAAAGRAAFLAIGGAERWADCFLAPAPPPAFVAAMHRALPVPVPEPMPAAMPEQALDLPIRLPGLKALRQRAAEAA